MSRCRVAFEALKWVVLLQTSRSIRSHLPAFERWLQADRRNWAAYVRARQDWFPWDRVALFLSLAPRVLTRKWAPPERKRVVIRDHHEFLWIALGISVVTLLLAWAPLK